MGLRPMFFLDPDNGIDSLLSRATIEQVLRTSYDPEKWYVDAESAEEPLVRRAAAALAEQCPVGRIPEEALAALDRYVHTPEMSIALARARAILRAEADGFHATIQDEANAVDSLVAEVLDGLDLRLASESFINMRNYLAGLDVITHRRGDTAARLWRSITDGRSFARPLDRFIYHSPDHWYRHGFWTAEDAASVAAQLAGLDLAQVEDRNAYDAICIVGGALSAAMERGRGLIIVAN